MIVPRISGSGGLLIAEGQSHRLDVMAMGLSGDLRANDYPPEVQAECVQRITRWRNESDAWKKAISAYEEARA